jgi:hypothetical protein
MRPSSAELITRISEALDATVLPAITDDKWAASVVRSATTLLNHLAKRVEIEAPVLLEDNEDARATLADVENSLGKRAALQVSIKVALALRDDIPAWNVVALNARNREYQSAVEHILRELYGTTDAAEQCTREVLLNYLRRRVGRERDLYFPAFMGPPF